MFNSNRRIRNPTFRWISNCTILSNIDTLERNVNDIPEEEEEEEPVSQVNNSNDSSFNVLRTVTFSPTTPPKVSSPSTSKATRRLVFDLTENVTTENEGHTIVRQPVSTPLEQNAPALIKQPVSMPLEENAHTLIGQPVSMAPVEETDHALIRQQVSMQMEETTTENIDAKEALRRKMAKNASIAKMHCKVEIF